MHRPSPPREPPGEGTQTEAVGSGSVGSPNRDSSLSPQPPRHGCFVLVLEPFQPEVGFRGLVANPDTPPGTRSPHAVPAIPRVCGTFTGSSHATHPGPSPNTVMPLTHGSTSPASSYQWSNRGPNILNGKFQK